MGTKLLNIPQLPHKKGGLNFLAVIPEQFLPFPLSLLSLQPNYFKIILTECLQNPACTFVTATLKEQHAMTCKSY